MNSVFNQAFVSYLSIIPNLLWTIALSLLEWFVPWRWYAKAIDKDIVLITGAGSGLGRALAVEYAKQNSSLVLWDMSEKGLRETKQLVEREYEVIVNMKKKRVSKKEEEEELVDADSRTCLIYKVDVSDRVEVQKYSERVNQDLNANLASGVKEKYISVLINNASIYHGLMLHELKDNQIERIFKMNVLAHFWTVRAFLPRMINNKKGHIVEIASMAGIAGIFKHVDYCATKYATVGFEESLNVELDYLGLGDKIHTTVVCSSFFDADLFSGFDTRVKSLMSAHYVAEETVKAMRCNHSRVLLPKVWGYLTYIGKNSLSRRSIMLFIKALKFAECLKEIKGVAANQY